MLNLDSTNFDTTVNSSTPVFVDFWAPWCGPCRGLSPKLDELSQLEEFQGKITFAKVNVDEYPELAQRFNIRGIPAMLIFKESTVVKELVGNQPSDNLKKFISEAL